MTESSVFRVYPSTPESIESLKYVEDRKEVHIVLAFARDYDATGNRNGKFVPYFNPNFEPEWISKFKNESKSDVKFFLSIGGRSAKYPFQIPPGNRDGWVRNAIQSLKYIVNNYGFDGIDVYYEHVTSRNDFDKAIRDVIGKLKDNETVITRASLTVSATLNSLYERLYHECTEYFDHVVYQSHNLTTHISKSDELVNIIDKLNYPPKTKIFAGHSILPSDWKYVPIPIFHGAIPKLLEKGIVSSSEWVVTDHDPET